MRDNNIIVKIEQISGAFDNEEKNQLTIICNKNQLPRKINNISELQ